MSLLTRRSTPAQLAANQTNGRLSSGPATPEGIERIREANTRHGFYSRAPGEALRVLGEDPEKYERLLESLRETWQPANEFENRLVERLARALWRMERSDRALEGMAVERLERLDGHVDRMACEAGARYERKLAGLNALMDAVGQASYFTSWAELETHSSVFGDKPKGRPGEVLVLMYRLLKPQAATGEATADKNSGPEPAEGVPVAEGGERYKERERLLTLLREEVDALKRAQAREGEELLETTSPYFRDSILVPDEPQAPLMLRMEDSSFRQVERLTNLLIKLKAKAAVNKWGGPGGDPTFAQAGVPARRPRAGPTSNE